MRSVLACVAVLVLLLVPAAGAPAAEWLAGDGHVHTCYSHDAYCGPQDDNTPTDFETPIYSSGGTVQQRFAEAALKGLDFLVVSDHNDTRAWGDPAFGSAGVLGVRAYEHSLSAGRGHAHVIGATRQFPESTPPAELAAAANADGALFQANHPTYKGTAGLNGCEDIATAGAALHWKLGFDVRPDTIEVWNPTALLPPAEVFWECWLQRGVRVPASSGSDSHGATQPLVGMPTLWVLARERSEDAIVEALRDGRTTITRLAPNMGAARLVIEADRDRDGEFESTMGDTVAPGTPMRARTDGLSATGKVRIRANGETLLEWPVFPGVPVPFKAPAEPGWVRATLLQEQRTADTDPNCDPSTPGGSSGLDLCTADLAYTAMTSPMYVERPGEPVTPVTGAPAGGTTTGGGSATGESGHDEPDDDPPMAPAAHSLGGAPLPLVPRQPASADSRAGLGPRTVTVRVRRLRGRRVRVSWAPAGWRYDVQVRARRGWRTLRTATGATRLTARASRRARRMTFRVRARYADGRPGPWVTRAVRLRRSRS